MKDLVCGMNVDETAAAAKKNYKGETYFFCSQQCAETFGRNAAQFAK